MRHGLVAVLTTAVCAVAAGARSFVAIAEWVADLPAMVAEHLGTAQRCPSESTIRRVVQDGDGVLAVVANRAGARGRPAHPAAVGAHHRRPVGLGRTALPFAPPPPTPSVGHLTVFWATELVMDPAAQITQPALYSH